MRDEGVACILPGPAPDARLGLEYRRLLNEVRRLDSELGRTILSESDYGSLVVEACSGNIHWSLAMEGHPLGEDDMRRMCAAFSRGERAAERGNIPQQEVQNHMKAHLRRDRYRLPMGAEDVLDLHSQLKSGCGFALPPGEWRRKPSPEGGAAPEDIERQMSKLMDWASHSPYDEMLSALLFLEGFLSIRPFEYGNEVTGRALFLLLLSDLGLGNIRLCQMEAGFLGCFFPGPAGLDAALAPTAQEAAASLLRSYRAAVDAFRGRDILKDLDEHSRTLALRAKEDISWQPLSEAYSWLPGLSEQRIRLKLNELVSLGVLEKEGRTRATRFRFKDPFLALRPDAEERRQP